VLYLVLEEWLSLDLWSSFALVTFVMIALDFNSLTTNAGIRIVLWEWRLIVQVDLSAICTDFLTAIEVWILDWL